ncbi:non-homologous end-joining factor 1-like [Dysidea avara]|uniref:non-homologous end-joining factor 1-like n=1 Tax=Dysidea avara TaxID=196820 RepID=UPI0033316116
MATAWRRNPLPSINTQCWKKFNIDNQDYLIRALTTDDSYEIQLFDVQKCITWEEALSSPTLVSRVKKYNPNIEAPLTKIIETLSQCLEEQKSNTQYILVHDEMKLTVRTKLSGLPFEWRFVLRQTSNDGNCSMVPGLMAMVSEYQRRNQELVKAIKKRDKEILDYRGSYGPPSRKHLETSAFDDKTFLNEMITSKEFEQSVADRVTTFVGSDCQQLYRDVELIREWLHKPPEEQAISMEDDATSGSWANRLPGSLLPPTTSPVKRSPVKLPKDVSPAKDVELQRRAELNKRLAEADDKKKAKKKKKLI